MIWYNSYVGASQVALVVRNWLANAGDVRDVSLIPGKILWRRKWQPTIPAWGIPWTEEPGGLQSIGLQRIGHGWSDLAHSHVYSKKWYKWNYLQNKNRFINIYNKLIMVTKGDNGGGGTDKLGDWDQHILTYVYIYQFSSVQSLSRVRLCDPMNCSMPGLPVHHQLPEFTQTHVHRVGNAVQPSHPLSSPSPPAPNPSQHQSLFQWVNSSHEVPKVLEFQP